AEEHACRLHAAGREAALTQRLPAEVARPGRAALPAPSAVSVLRRSMATEVTLESAGGPLLLTTPGPRFHLEGADAGALPAPPPAPTGSIYRVAPAALRGAVRATLFAAGPGSRRYRLEAVLWELGRDRLTLVATDNRRLAAAELPARLLCGDAEGERL